MNVLKQTIARCKFICVGILGKHFVLRAYGDKLNKQFFMQYIARSLLPGCVMHAIRLPPMLPFFGREWAFAFFFFSDLGFLDSAHFRLLSLYATQVLESSISSRSDGVRSFIVCSYSFGNVILCGCSALEHLFSTWRGPWSPSRSFVMLAQDSICRWFSLMSWLSICHLFYASF